MRRSRHSRLFAATRGHTARARWDVDRILRGLGASSAFADDVLGDLTEEQRRRAASRGAFAARWWYLREAVRSAPHLAWNAVRHGGTRGRARVAALLGMLALLPAAALAMLLLMKGPPAELLVDRAASSDWTEGIVVNSMHPVQLAMHVRDAKGRALDSTKVRFRWASGVPVAVSRTGAVTCTTRGDAVVRASLGALVTDLRLRCRPVRELRVGFGMNFVVGDSAREVSVLALDPHGQPVDLLSGELRVDDSTVATLHGSTLRPVAPGWTAVTMRFGDHETSTLVSVYEVVPTLDNLRPDQRLALAHLRVARGDTVRWRLPRGLFWLTWTTREAGQPLPHFEVNGPVMCMPAFGPSVDDVDCLVRGPDATIQITHPGGSAPALVGDIGISRRFHHEEEDKPSVVSP